MDREEELVSISDFSRLSGIKRKNLIFYDECGLIVPDRVGANGYRYYSTRQLAIVRVILALREIGFPLKDIKDILSTRSPRRILDSLGEQERSLDEEIRRLEENRKLIQLRKNMIGSALRIGDETIELEQRPAESVLFGPDVAASPGQSLHEDITAFHLFAEENGIKPGYPACVEMAHASLVSGDWGVARRLYCKTVSGANGAKPAGLYLVAHAFGGDENRHSLYNRAKEYIRINKLILAGDGYEEKLIDEFSASDEEDFVTRLEIEVKKNQ